MLPEFLFAATIATVLWGVASQHWKGASPPKRGPPATRFSSDSSTAFHPLPSAPSLTPSRVYTPSVPVAQRPPHVAPITLARLPRSLEEDCMMPIFESMTEEFKAAQANDYRLIKMFERYAVAFLNSSGGRLWLGIHDEGYVMGINMDRKRYDELCLAFDSSAFKNIHPQVDACLYQVDWIPVTKNGKAIPNRHVVCITFHAPTNSRQVYACVGRDPVMRAAASVRRMSSTVVQERKIFGKPGSPPSLPKVHLPSPSKLPNAHSASSTRTSTAFVVKKSHSPPRAHKKCASNSSTPVVSVAQPPRPLLDPQPCKASDKSKSNRTNSSPRRQQKKSHNIASPKPRNSRIPMPPAPPSSPAPVPLVFPKNTTEYTRGKKR